MLNVPKILAHLNAAPILACALKFARALTYSQARLAGALAYATHLKACKLTKAGKNLRIDIFDYEGHDL